MDPMFVCNLDVLIAAVEARSENQFDQAAPLDPLVPVVMPQSLVSLIGRLSHFRRHYKLSALGELVVTTADGTTLGGDAVLSYLFGSFDGVTAAEVLAAPYGACPWDDSLVAQHGGWPSLKELLLSRLHWARLCAAGESAGRAFEIVSRRLFSY